MRKLVFDTGPFLLLFTDEPGSKLARETIVRHEKGLDAVFIHPNCLAEAYSVLARLKAESSRLLQDIVDPEVVVRSGYANLNVLQDERTTLNLGSLRTRYRGIPWGDLSSSALAMRLSDDEEKVPVVILDRDPHFARIEEVQSLPVSKLEP